MRYAPIYRISLVSDGRLPYESALRQSSDVAKFVRPLFDGLDREQFVIVLLNAKHRPIGAHVVSLGSLTASVVHPRLCVATHKRGYVVAPFMWSRAHLAPDFPQRIPFRRNISWPTWRRNASKEAAYGRQAIRKRICRRPAQSRAIRCWARAILGALRPAAQIDSGSEKQRIPIDLCCVGNETAEHRRGRSGARQHNSGRNITPFMCCNT
jgi:hypothetical protein